MLKDVLFFVILLLWPPSQIDKNIELYPSYHADNTVEWNNQTDDPDILGVSAMAMREHWSVTVSVAEFIREEPLESEFREAIYTSLMRVKGVTTVFENDRENWTVKGGDIEGKDLVISCVQTLHTMYPTLKAYMEDL